MAIPTVNVGLGWNTGRQGDRRTAAANCMPQYTKDDFKASADTAPLLCPPLSLQFTLTA